MIRRTHRFNEALGNFKVPVDDSIIDKVENRAEKYHWDALYLFSTAANTHDRDAKDCRDYIMKKLEPLWIAAFWGPWLGHDHDQQKRRIQDAGGKQAAWMEFYGICYMLMFKGSGIGKDAWGKDANARAEVPIISDILKGQTKGDIDLMGMPLDEGIKLASSFIKKYAIVPRLKDINQELLSGGITGVSTDAKDKRPTVNSYDPAVQNADGSMNNDDDGDDYSRGYEDPTFDSVAGTDLSDEPFIVRWNSFCHDPEVLKTNSKGLGLGVVFRLVLEHTDADSMGKLAKQLGLNYTTVDQTAKKAAALMQSKYNIDLRDLGTALQNYGSTKLASKLPKYHPVSK